MKLLLDTIRHNPLLWLLVFVSALFVGKMLEPEAQTMLFVLSVLAIFPLAALLSYATESVAAKTGDTVGGLLNATDLRHDAVPVAAPSSVSWRGTAPVAVILCFAGAESAQGFRVGRCCSEVTGRTNRGIHDCKSTS
jgi:hypothetical protein